MYARLTQCRSLGGIAGWDASRRDLGAPEEDGAHRVGKPAHQQLFELEPAAEEEGEVGGEGEIRRKPEELRLVVRDQLVAVLRMVSSGEHGTLRRARRGNSYEAPAIICAPGTRWENASTWRASRRCHVSG